MSINLENPETVLGKVDAALNFVAQIRLAMMIGDRPRVDKAINEIERHLNNAMDQIQEEETP
jgi:hypothetical protein